MKLRTVRFEENLGKEEILNIRKVVAPVKFWRLKKTKFRKIQLLITILLSLKTRIILHPENRGRQFFFFTDSTNVTGISIFPGQSILPIKAGE
jgi:hypothetical protein